MRLYAIVSHKPHANLVFIEEVDDFELDVRPAFGILECKRKVLAHREGRTRSLQITVGRCNHPPKSLTLYPIELGGH